MPVRRPRSCLQRIALGATVIAAAAPAASTADRRASEVCDALTDRIALLASENGCRVSADCAQIDLPTPLGCGRPVSRSQIQPIEDALTAYQRQCRPLLYSCLGPRRDTWCDHGRCIPGLKLGDARAPSVSSRDHFGRPIPNRR